mgnify:CR=1 FL=1
MRYSNKLKAGTAMLLPLAMAACSDRNDTTSASPPPPGSPPPVASIQSRISTSFASFFDASNTSDPRDPTAADVPAVNPTADPLDN